MTREEAKTILVGKINPCLNGTDWKDAVDMAIKALEQEQYYKDLANSYEKTINKLTKAISEQEPKTGHWIPVSERLPEKNVEVLATTEWDAVTIAEMYSVNDWFIHEGTTNAETDEIVAWMPLPEPYKEREG